MTEQPPLPPPIPSAPTRPTALTVIAILGIVFGALNIVCLTPFSLYSMFANTGQPNPMMDYIKDTPLLYAWTMLSMLLGVLLAATLLAGSIGALRQAPWSRLALLIYAGGSILLGLIGVVVWFMMPTLLPEGMDNPTVRTAT